MATNPDMRSVTSTGQWSPVTIERESTEDRALRIALETRAAQGRPPRQMSNGDMDPGGGLWLYVINGFNKVEAQFVHAAAQLAKFSGEVEVRQAAQGAKLDKALVFIEAANEVKAARGKTAREIAIHVIKGVALLAAGGVVTELGLLLARHVH